jgi:hypothetical protein
VSDDDDFFGMLIGLFFGAIITGFVLSENLVSKDDVKSEKVFIVDKATYKCKKTNELSLEEKEGK